MGRLLSGLLLLNLLIACGEKLPPGVLSKKKLPDLLVELHQLDAYMASMPIDSIRKLIRPTYERVFEYHHIDSNVFIRTIEYYSSRPGELQQIYEIVNQRLQAAINEDIERRAEENRRQAAADSLRAIHRRDSLILVARDSMDLKRKRHLLLRYESDSTLDRRIPVTFINYSIHLLDDMGLGRLDFGPYTRLDSANRREEYLLPKQFAPDPDSDPGLQQLIPRFPADTLPSKQQLMMIK